MKAALPQGDAAFTHFSDDGCNLPGHFQHGMVVSYLRSDHVRVGLIGNPQSAFKLCHAAVQIKRAKTGSKQNQIRIVRRLRAFAFKSLPHIVVIQHFVHLPLSSILRGSYR